MKKKNYLQLLAIVMVTMLSVCFVSCEKDDSVEDPEGTISIGLRNENNGYTFLYLFGSSNDEYYICINEADNFECWDYYLELVDVGKVKGLGAINSIPASGWTDEVKVQPGHGYIARAKSGKYRDQCARIYVERYMTSDDYIIGANIKYQAPWNPSTSNEE